ncbi:691_t:CDS:2 [Ambispora gerdemannii]|uniref:691_t:CDS:1 n=1 Tax=Ambispora gerdemannii TaxID=144530 RepID=A0A9N9ANQ8_9GLOM|nr:691_t:CDS:2 [Ambispora gerdemannii]
MSGSKCQAAGLKNAFETHFFFEAGCKIQPKAVTKAFECYLNLLIQKTQKLVEMVLKRKKCLADALNMCAKYSLPPGIGALPLKFTAPGIGALLLKLMDALPQRFTATKKEKLKKQLAKHRSALSVNSTSKKEVWIYYHKGDYLEVLQARKVKGKNNGTKSAAKKNKPTRE